MARPRTIPKIGSATLRSQRLRQRRAGQEPTGYAAITRSGALHIRRAMFDTPAMRAMRDLVQACTSASGSRRRRGLHHRLGEDVYGTNITNAILRAMHRLVREAGEEHPVEALLELVADYRPGVHPMVHLNIAVAEYLVYPDAHNLTRPPVELAYPDPLAGI